MKKYIPLVFCLLMLCGCGKKSTNSENSNPKGDTTTAQAEAVTEKNTENTEPITTTEPKEQNVIVSAVTSGPPRSKKIYTGSVVTVFRGPNVLVPDFGEDYNVYGTVSPVPVAEVPATTVEALIDPTLAPDTETLPNGEPNNPDNPENNDFRDQSSLTFEISDSGVNVLRAGSSVQTLSADTTAASALIAGGSYTQQQLIISTDFDFDGYTDLFIAESVGTMNTLGKYFRYDASTGLYTEWQSLNNIGYFVNVNFDSTLSVHIKDGAADYEDRSYCWSGSALLPVHMDKQYTTENGDIYLDHYDYSSGTGILYSREQYIDGNYIEVSLT